MGSANPKWLGTLLEWVSPSFTKVWRLGLEYSKLQLIFVLLTNCNKQNQRLECDSENAFHSNGDVCKCFCVYMLNVHTC